MIVLQSDLHKVYILVAIAQYMSGYTKKFREWDASKRLGNENGLKNIH